jgi:hypothetical protein
LQRTIADIIGNVGNQFGLEYYFYHLYATFSEAESALLTMKRKGLEELINESYEMRQSIYFDTSYQAHNLPLIETLRTSYLIVIHSEIDKVWNQIQDIYNNNSSKGTYQKLNYKYKYDSKYCLDRIVSKYDILFAYNLIRNRIVHPKANDKEYELPKEFMNRYEKGELEYFKIINNDGKMNFIIVDMQFGKRYSDIFIDFLNEIKQSL